LDNVIGKKAKVVGATQHKAFLLLNLHLARLYDEMHCNHARTPDIPPFLQKQWHVRIFLSQPHHRPSMQNPILRTFDHASPKLPLTSK
jgi:hypothetical protein